MFLLVPPPPGITREGGMLTEVPASEMPEVVVVMAAFEEADTDVWVVFSVWVALSCLSRSVHRFRILLVSRLSQQHEFVTSAEII